MSSIGLTGLSNISTDALQVRYEKALKQINKLIEINRQLKESATVVEQQLKSSHAEQEQLRQANCELDEENNILEEKYMQLQNHLHELEGYCKKLEDELEDSQAGGEELRTRLQQQEMKFTLAMQEEVDKFNELVKEAEQIHHDYQANLSVIQLQEIEKERWKQEEEQLKTQVAKLQQENAELALSMTERYVDDLRGKLQKSQNCINVLMSECTQLKSKQIDLEVLEEKQKVEKFIGINDVRQNEAVRTLIEQYKKKVRELEEEKKILHDKYKALKGRVNKSPSKENFQKKIQCLEKLTEKQQKQIARIIETYDKELHALHRDNTRLRESYHQTLQKLSYYNTQILQKDKVVNDLTGTNQRCLAEIEALKKMNKLLAGSKEREKVKELSEVKSQISHTESITIMPKKSVEECCGSCQSNQSTPQGSPLNAYNKQPMVLTSIDSTQDQPSTKKSITLRYSSPADDNFKFIQSVNIIHGYNVSLSENSRSVK